MAEKISHVRQFTKGLIKENPVLALVLGTCPTLAVTGSLVGSLSMGLAATCVLLCSNVVISALRRVIPDKVRIPCYIVIIAAFVTLVKMVMNAYVPEIYNLLGVYLDLLVVNCIILGRAEMFARNNTVLDSALDGIGMGTRLHLRAPLHGTCPRGARRRNLLQHRDSRHIGFHHRRSSVCARRILRVRLPHRACQPPDQGKGREKAGIRLCGLPVCRRLLAPE